MSCSLFGNHGGSVRLQVLLFVNLNEFRPSAFSSREGGISLKIFVHGAYFVYALNLRYV